MRSVFEFGAGGGWNLVPFIKAGFEVSGLEYSPELVQFGNNRGINLRQGGLENLTGSYDLILLNHVMEHFTDITTLARLRAALNPNGRIFVEVPNIDNFTIGQLQNAHVFYFTLHTLRLAAALADCVMEGFWCEDNGHMSALLSASSSPLVPDIPFGHQEDIRKIINRYGHIYRRRKIVRIMGRELDRIGVGSYVRRLMKKIR